MVQQPDPNPRSSQLTNRASAVILWGEHDLGGSASGFTARVLPGSGSARIVLSGELDMAAAPILQDRLAVVEAKEPSTIVIDLREVTFLDSSGLRALVAARRRARSNPYRLVLTDANPGVRRMFDLIDMDFLLDDVVTVLRI
jgi:anti-anti-sigma factor